MKIKNKRSYVGSTFYCPKCEQNDLLFEETEKEIYRILFFTINENLIVNRIYCERCKCKIDKADLKIVKSNTYEINGIKKTINKETFFLGDKTITNTRILIEEQIPNVKNKTLYFDMLFMLIDYIETYQPNINADNNRFYQLSIEYKIIDDSEFSENFEEKIIQKFKECIEEFTQAEINNLLRNSVDVLKGEMIIEIKIQELYFNLFSLMQIGNLTHQSFFQSLRK